MTGSVVVLVIGVIALGLFLKLLVELAREDPPGPNSTSYWAKSLFWLALLVGAIVTALAVKGGWRP